MTTYQRELAFYVTLGGLFWAVVVILASDVAADWAYRVWRAW